ncbi:MAG: hypothetical protein NTW86_00970, partial [Candidatus Sumerlaeota bacterium]|nr:hypothetical protein [Candidatus Sumerlaeota bacterium]
MLALRMRCALRAVPLLLAWSATAWCGPLFTDSFEGAGRPPSWVTFNAPSEQFWTVFRGQLVSGNGHEIVADEGRSYAVVSVADAEGWLDSVVSVDAWMSDRNGRLGIVARWKSPQEHIEGSLEFNEGRRTARIVRASMNALGTEPERTTLAEGDTEHARLAIPVMNGGNSPGDAHRIALRLNGPEIVLSADGVVLLRAEDPQPRPGAAGLMIQQAFAYFGAFRVDPPNGESESPPGESAVGAEP